MSPLFITLTAKVIPLYFNIFLGFLAGRFWNAHRDTISRIMFYMISPIVIFSGAVSVKLDAGVLSVPVITFAMGSLLSVAFYRASRNVFSDNTRNILAFSAGTGNMGFFGLPIAIELFDAQTVGIYILAVFGVSLYENTVGFYLASKGHHTARESVMKVVGHPAIYAFTAGLLLNSFQVPIPQFIMDYLAQMRSVFAVLGMMIVGLSIATIHHFKIDLHFLSLAFLAKFVIWPLVTLLFISADLALFHLFDQNIHRVLLLLSIAPMAVNTIVMSSLMHGPTEKAATTVLISTIIAIFYVPTMLTLFF